MMVLMGVWMRLHSAALSLTTITKAALHTLPSPHLPLHLRCA